MNAQLIRREEKESDDSILLVHLAQYHGKVVLDQVMYALMINEHLGAQISGPPRGEPEYVAQMLLPDIIPEERRSQMYEFTVDTVTALIALKNSGERLLQLQPLKIDENLHADPEDVPESFLRGSERGAGGNL